MFYGLSVFVNTTSTITNGYIWEFEETHIQIHQLDYLGEKEYISGAPLDTYKSEILGWREENKK